MKEKDPDVCLCRLTDIVTTHPLHGNFVPFVSSDWIGIDHFFH